MNAGPDSAPLLTYDELCRPGMQATRDLSDRLLADRALVILWLHACVEARRLEGQAWPSWVTTVFAWRCEDRDRQAVRRELREMAPDGGAR